MTDSTKIPRGIRRAPSSGATPPRPDPTRSYLPPVPATEVLLRRDRLSTRIAANATEQVDQLALIGYPALEPGHLAVIEQTIRLVARGELER